MSEPCQGCKAVIECNDPSDFAASQGFFPTQGYSFLMDCPPGYVCLEGVFPRVIFIDKDQIPTIQVPPGVSILRLQGCQSVITGTIGQNFTAAQIQAVVNAMFLAWAQQEANCANLKLMPAPVKQPPKATFTLGDIATVPCVGSAYNAQVPILGKSTAPYTYSIFPATLPPGIVDVPGINGTLRLTGTPTTAGTYTFTVRITDATGLYADRTYTISPLGITTGSPLTDATWQAPYTTTLASAGGVSPYTYTLLFGSLPVGLSLSSAGVISGTATVIGIYNFTVAVEDSVTGVCLKNFSLEVAATPCPDWTTLLWGFHFGGAYLATTGSATASFTPDHTASDSFDTVVTQPVPNTPEGGSAENRGYLMYNGSGCNCNLHIVSDQTGYPPNNHADVECQFDGIFIIIQNLNSLPGVNTFDLPFSLPDTGGVPKQFVIIVRNYNDNTLTTFPGRIEISGQITNI